MSDINYLRRILAEQYGITTDAQLNDAIQKMSKVNIGVMVSATTTNNQKEAAACA